MATPSSNPYTSRRAGASPSASSSSEHIIGKFKRMDHIGKGSFAEVYRGIHIEKRQAVAIKSVNMNKLNKKLKDNLVSEISILRSLHHPHIVSLIDCQEAPSRMHIIMEFCELGDLSAFIKKRADLANHPQTQRMIEKYPNPEVGGLNEVIVRHFAKQMASALEFLRSKNYIHRDLKPQNLLLNPSSMFYSQSGTLERMPLAASANSLIPATGIESLPMLKIADFGFARILPTTSLAETLCGSPLYMAPEILKYEKYNATADLWSVGTVLFEMMCARPPFRANNHVELLRKIEAREDHIRFPEGIISSRAMKNLIRALLKRNPVERMSYEKFFSDPVIREAIPDLVDEDLPESLQTSELEQPVVPTRREQKMPVAATRRESDSQYARSPKDTTGLGATPPSRPASRTNPAGRVSSSPQSAFAARRASNTQAEAGQESGQSRRVHRPALTSAATAPVRAVTGHDQAVAAGAIGHRRRFSRDNQAPSPSGLKEHFERERTPQTAAANALREAAERAEQDSTLDEGFVFVEKRRVMIDAFADEVADMPQAQPNHMTGREGTMVRRATTQGSPTSTTGAVVPSKAVQIQNTPLHPYPSIASYERRRSYRPFESATSAITKAINMVNIRGLGLSPPVIRGLTPPQGQAIPRYARNPTPPAQNNSLVVVGNGGQQQVTVDEERIIVKRIEELAHISHAVFSYAGVKYVQIVPIPPSEPDSGIGSNGVLAPGSGEDELEDEDDPQTPLGIVTVAEEALVLFVKSMTVVQIAMNIGSVYLERKKKTPDPSLPQGFVKVIEWLRQRWEEAWAKSEICARKLKAAQHKLPHYHPSHPDNHPPPAGNSESQGIFGDLYVNPKVVANKILFDRAIEMSKTAAINELTNDDLPGTEMNYKTATMMVEAILEGDDEPENVLADGRQDTDVFEGLPCETRKSIEFVLQAMRERLSATQRKLAAPAPVPVPVPSGLSRVGR